MSLMQAITPYHYCVHASFGKEGPTCMLFMMLVALIHTISAMVISGNNTVGKHN